MKKDTNITTKSDIIRIVSGASGAYTPYTIFRDWICCLALAIANTSSPWHDDIWKSREEEYMSIMKKYPKEMTDTFAEMTAVLVELYESGFDDFLGDIYMKSGCGNSSTGQFFTPYNISRMMAEMAIPKNTSEAEPYSLAEPSCGGGASIVAAAETLKNRGLNYQKCMRVVAQDLDWTAVYMTYIACSFYGIDAIVVQGDTLIEPYVKGYPEHRVFRTPKNRGALI